MQFLFVPGEAFPAANANSIDPDSLVSPLAGYLTGGTSPSATTVFDTLGRGANDGKFSINVDGTLYSNIAIDFLKYAAANTNNESGGGMNQNGGVFSVSFVLATTCLLNSITLRAAYWGAVPVTRTVTIKKGGVTLGTATASVSGGGAATFTFASPIRLSNVGDTFDVSIDGTQNMERDNGSGDTRLYFVINGKAYENLSTANIATLLQTAIRAVTSNFEEVTYDTDKYKITSATGGIESKILKLISPASGTDISGNGATKYLDLGTGATETTGTGDYYYLLRTNKDGSLPDGYISTQTITSGNFTVPRGTQKTIIQYDLVTGGGAHYQGDLILTKNKPTGIFNNNSAPKIIFTWTGNEIIISDTAGFATESIKAYFYKW